MKYFRALLCAVISLSACLSSVHADEARLAFYGEAIKSQGLVPDFSLSTFRWEEESVSDPRIPAAAEAGYNTTVYWLVHQTSGKREYAFRPFMLKPTCNSACQLFVFHLFYRSDWSKVGLLQEELRPLTKINHQLLSAEDVSALTTMAQELPKTLQHVENAKNFVDPTSAQKQTWTFARPMLIAGGAYTAHAVFRAAESSYRHLQSEGQKRVQGWWQKLGQNVDRLRFSAKHFASKRRAFRVELDFIDASLANADAATTTRLADSLLQVLQQASHLPAGATQDGVYRKAIASLDRHAEVLLVAQSHKLLAGLMLLASEQPAVEKPFVVSLLRESRSFVGLLPDDLQRLLALSTRWFSSGVTAADLDLEPKLDHLWQELSELLPLSCEVALAFDRAGQAELAGKYALYSMRLDPAARVRCQALSDGALQAYRALGKKNRLAQALREAEVVAFPRVSLRDLKGEAADGAAYFAAQASGLKLVVFFASWCGHCHKFLAQAMTQLPAAAQKKVLLIEVGRSPGMREALVQAFGIEEKAPELARRFFYTDERIAEIETVPTFFLVDSEGQMHRAPTGLDFAALEPLFAAE